MRPVLDAALQGNVFSFYLPPVEGSPYKPFSTPEPYTHRAAEREKTIHKYFLLE